jgi:hypothetical protein
MPRSQNGATNSAKTPAFTTRHYVMVAKIIQNYDDITRRRLCEDFTEIFDADNPLFRPARFEQECNKAPENRTWHAS